MHRLTIRGGVPNRTPSINGRTMHLRAGSVELVHDEDVDALKAWIAKDGHSGDYSLEGIAVQVIQDRPTVDQAETTADQADALTREQAITLIGSTRGRTMAEIIQGVEEAGFDVPEVAHLARTKAALVEALVEAMIRVEL